MRTASLLLCLLLCPIASADELWTITAYCSCEKCCGKSDGIMANGQKVYVGACACNVLPLGTRVFIPDISDNRSKPGELGIKTYTAGFFTIEDRGSHRLFDNQKRIDVYVPTHEQALRFGAQKSRVYEIKTEAPMTDKERFEEEVNKAYDILWSLYRPKNNAVEGCDFPLEYEDKLLSMLNFIDDAMGR